MKKPSYGELSERDRAILKATIEDYIEQNHPIGSHFLKVRHLFPFSPATIRNTLAKLEALGLLTHLHTSSGRIPTNAGYRFYVDELLESKSLPSRVYDEVMDELSQVADNVDELMHATATMLAKVSHLFGVVVIADVQKSILTDIELIPLASERIMMVLAMTSGLIQSVVLNLDVSVNEHQLTLITSILKERLVGLRLDEVQKSCHDRLKDTEIYHHEIVQVLLHHPQRHFTIEQERLVYTSPFDQLLVQPEFQEIEVLRKTLLALDSHYLGAFLTTHTGEAQEYTFIGEENHDALLNHCSVLVTRFESDQIAGHLAILGPTRLPYNVVKPMLGNFAEIMAHVC
jgi:heat-inducible transcriptional repressor